MRQTPSLLLATSLRCLAVVIALAGPAMAQTKLPNSELRYILSASATTDYVVSGISASGGNPSFQPFFELDWNGFYGGLAISYVRVARDRTEFDLYAGHRRRLANNIFFDLSYRRFYLNATGDCCGEAKARVIFPVGESLGAELLLGYNHTLGAFNRRGRVLWDVSDRVLVTGAYGETSNNDNEYWNIGATWNLPYRLALNLRYEGAETGDAGLVASLGWSTVSNDIVRLFTNPFQ